MLLETAWVTPGTTVIPYGTVSAVDLDLVEVMDKVVVDDWGQATVGPFGALRGHVDSGRLGRHNLHAEPDRRSSMPDAHAEGLLKIRCW